MAARTGKHPHIDYGYAVTSHSSQGATADHVLMHVDTEQAHDHLVNSRMAYFSVSRGRYDAQIYTNDAEKLGEDLSRDVSKQSALETEHGMGGAGPRLRASPKSLPEIADPKEQGSAPAGALFCYLSPPIAFMVRRKSPGGTFGK